MKIEIDINRTKETKEKSQIVKHGSVTLTIRGPISLVTADFFESNGWKISATFLHANVFGSSHVSFRDHQQVDIRFRYDNTQSILSCEYNHIEDAFDALTLTRALDAYANSVIEQTMEQNVHIKVGAQAIMRRPLQPMYETIMRRPLQPSDFSFVVGAVEPVYETIKKSVDKIAVWFDIPELRPQGCVFVSQHVPFKGGLSTRLYAFGWQELGQRFLALPDDEIIKAYEELASKLYRIAEGTGPTHKPGELADRPENPKVYQFERRTEIVVVPMGP